VGNYDGNPISKRTQNLPLSTAQANPGKHLEILALGCEMTEIIQMLFKPAPSAPRNGVQSHLLKPIFNQEQPGGGISFAK